MSFHSDLFGWEYVWRNFAEQKGGEAIDNGDGTGLAGLAIPVQALRAYVVYTPFVHHGKKKQKGTTVMTSFQPSDDFAFSLQTEKLTDQVGKAMGMQDVQVQDQEFDKHYLIQGNDVGRIQTLFSDVSLRDNILFDAPSQIRIESDSSRFDPEWTVKAGNHVIVLRYDHLMDKLDQLQIAADILTAIVQGLATLRTARGGVSSPGYFAPEVEAEVDEKPVQSQSHRLHSPLLDRS